MACILAVSSQVAHGSVGLSVIVPALQALGHEVVALPTVLLSNHPGGHAQVAGLRVPSDTLSAMLAALHFNGRLARIDAVLSGYLPSAGHVAVVAALVSQLRASTPDLPYLCDPVIGDWPNGIYIEVEAAAAIRDRLLPLATVLTPNVFELGWITGLSTATRAEAAQAMRALPAPLLTIATSVPVAGAASANVLANVVMLGQRQLAVIEVERQPHVAHGTGDLLSAVVCGIATRSPGPTADRGAGVRYYADRAAFTASVAPAVEIVEHIIAASTGADQLRLQSLQQVVRQVMSGLNFSPD
jgi:pyridoxine kinase